MIFYYINKGHGSSILQICEQYFSVSIARMKKMLGAATQFNHENSQLQIDIEEKKKDTNRKPNKYFSHEIMIFSSLFQFE